MSAEQDVKTGGAGDGGWDDFLATHPLGQFQQSSLWARVKACEGWRAVREIFRDGSRIVGGFQLLVRSSRLGRIGYISKGPVLLPEQAGRAEEVLHVLLARVRSERLQALIVQPPDVCTTFPPLFAQPPFLPNRLVSIIQANCEVPLTGGFTTVERRLRAHTRQEARQAMRRGVVLRVGGCEDLPAFFALMCASCARQRDGQPNPGSVQLLEAVWDAFQPAGHLRLDLAEIDGRPVAGLLSVMYGARVTFWKKGWSGEHARAHPNSLLQMEALRWAADGGYAVCDFAAMGSDLARTLLAGATPTEKQRLSRDFFNLGFGGVPVLLPEARALIPHPVMRLGYRAWLRYHNAGRMARKPNR